MASSEPSFGGWCVRCVQLAPPCYSLRIPAVFLCFWPFSRANDFSTKNLVGMDLTMKTKIALTLIAAAVALGACRREEAAPVPMKLGGPAAEQPAR
jgi:hypothetical protein